MNNEMDGERVGNKKFVIDYLNPGWVELGWIAWDGMGWGIPPSSLSVYTNLVGGENGWSIYIFVLKKLIIT